MIPFSMVRDKHFRNMLREVNHKVPTMHPEGLVKHIGTKAEVFRVAVTKMMKGEHVAVTTDGWTSKQNVAYVALTAHYISDKWEVENLNLGCSPHAGGKTAVDHKQELMRV